MQSKLRKELMGKRQEIIRQTILNSKAGSRNSDIDQSYFKAILVEPKMSNPQYVYEFEHDLRPAIESYPTLRTLYGRPGLIIHSLIDKVHLVPDPKQDQPNRL